MQLPSNSLTLDRVTRIMRRASSQPDASVVSWQVNPIAYANVGTDSRGLFQLSTITRTNGRQGKWEAIIKVSRPLPDGTNTAPTSAHYWKREALAYTSRLLDSLPDRLNVPRLYEEEMVQGSLWLWLEKIQPDLVAPWPLSRFRLAAYHLGLFNGQYLAGRPIPNDDWLSQRMTRVWAEENAYTLPLIARAEVWESAPLRLAFPRPIQQRLLRLWENRQAYFAALDALPQTLCHHDAGHRNLFATRNAAGTEQTMLIDWELVGPGAMGEELGNLFAPALINFEVAPEQAEEFATLILAGYQEGIIAAGGEGDMKTIRTGFAISAVFRWVFAAAGWPVAIVTDQSGQAERQTEEQWGKPMEQVYQQWAGLAYYLLELAEEFSF